MLYITDTHQNRTLHGKRLYIGDGIAVAEHDDGLPLLISGAANVVFEFDGGDRVVDVGTVALLPTAFLGKILSWRIGAYPAAQVTLDLWKNNSETDLPSSPADSITPSNKPTTGAVRNIHRGDTANWTTVDIVDLDNLLIKVVANTGATKIVLTLVVQTTPPA